MIAIFCTFILCYNSYFLCSENGFQFPFIDWTDKGLTGPERALTTVLVASSAYDYSHWVGYWSIVESLAFLSVCSTEIFKSHLYSRGRKKRRIFPKNTITPDRLESGVPDSKSSTLTIRTLCHPQVNSAFRALSLATQTTDILFYSPPSKNKMASHEFLPNFSQNKLTFWADYSLVIILKQLFTSVSVKRGG